MRADLTAKDVNTLADIAERIGTAPRGEVITVFVGRYHIEFHEVLPTFQGLASVINEDRLKTAEAKVKELERRVDILIHPLHQVQENPVAVERDAARAEVKTLEARCAELMERAHKAEDRCKRREVTIRRMWNKLHPPEKENLCPVCKGTKHDGGEICEWCEEWDPKVI